MGIADNGIDMDERKETRFAWQQFVPLTGGQGGGVNLAPFLTQAFSGTGNMVEFFNAAFRMAIAIGVILAVLRIVYGGFVYMTTDLFTAKNSAKEILKNAVMGLFLLLAIWLILNQINPNLLNLDLLQSLNQAPSNCVDATAC